MDCMRPNMDLADTERRRMSTRFLCHLSSKALRVVFHARTRLFCHLGHVDFFPLPGQEQHLEPFFSPNAGAARRDYISVELWSQMLISFRLKVKAPEKTAVFPQAFGFLSFESESVWELKMESCCWWGVVLFYFSLSFNTQSKYLHSCKWAKMRSGPSGAVLGASRSRLASLTWLRSNRLYDETRLLLTTITRLLWWKIGLYSDYWVIFSTLTPPHTYEQTIVQSNRGDIDSS